MGVADSELAARLAVRDAVFQLPINRTIGTLVRHHIPDLLESGPVEGAALAAQAGLHPLSTTRALRALAGHGLFREVKSGVFEHTPASDLLRDRPGGMRNFALFFTADHVWRQFGGLEHSLRTGESTFEHEYGIAFWDFIEARPQLQVTFNAMLGELRAHEHVAIAAAYEWTTVTTIVDVGGGNGSLLAAILETNGRLRGALLDQEEVLPDADAHLRSRGVRERCELIPCNFFEALPATGEAWILSQILHDWDDASCRAILERCRARLRAGDRVLVVEMVTVPGEPDRRCGFSDLNMLGLFGEARQRTAEEYGSLFAACGLALSRVIPTDCPFSIVEALPAS